MSSRYQNQNPADGDVYNILKLGGDHLVSPHFKLEEFQCKDGTIIVIIHPALVELLEELRRDFGAPVTINSGFRTGAYNKKIGGAKNSAHLRGTAADIVIAGTTPKQVQNRVKGLYAPGGVGSYLRFTHVDVEQTGRRW